MIRRLLQFVVFNTLTIGAAVALAGGVTIYDENADAKRELDAAMAEARSAGRLVLVVFGANWCPDCRKLDEAMNETDTGCLIAEHYTVLKVDVGRFNKNTDLSEQMGIAIRRGIPASVILSGEGKRVAVADGRAMEQIARAGKPALVNYLSGPVDAAVSAIGRGPSR